ncbi:MAG: hypothetical protein K9K67_12390 [Bacteriovoracaceae bacterium]|nr:hypothetical protein [Bacteriovoracaceae bacterium]
MEPSLTPKSPRKRPPKGLLGRLVKATTVHALCFALIYTPAVQAQELMQAIGGAMQIVRGGFQQAIQQQQAAIAQAQLQQQMASLQPQPVPSKYHPQCAVSKAVTDFPVGACSNPITDEAGQAQAAAFRELAVSYDSFFQNLLAESQNGGQAIGVQCIAEENKKAEAKLQDRINSLQAIINQVKMESQVFEQNQQKIKEEMDKNRDILYGNKSRNQTTLNTNFLAEFTPSCQTFYKNTGQTTILGKGFAGLRDNSEAMKNQAGTFINNQTSYVEDINNQLKAVRDQIKKDGLSVASPQAIENILKINGKTFDFGSSKVVIDATIQNFSSDFAIIQRDLAAVGFNVDQTDLNGDFNERMSRFSKGAGEFFRKEAVASCVNGEGDTGIGISTQQILQGLRHRTASGSSTTLSSYRTALQNILNSDAFINDKMAAIQRLDQRYGVGDIFVQVQGADAQTRSVTPYGLYKQQIEICKARIEQDDTFSTSEGLRKKGGSVSERIADAERALKKAINLEKNFSNELTSAIFNRVVNCKGIQKSEEKCMPGQNGSLPALNTADDKFCIQHASTCANQARNCYIETDTIVKNKQQAMSTMAAEYNARVSGLIAKQQFFLKQVVGEVIQSAELLKQFIPGSKYAFPADLFVKMPQEKIDPEYGVAIAGDLNNIDELTKDLPRKLGDLQKLLRDQKDLVRNELASYLAAQKAGMNKDKGKWDKLKGECEAAINAFNTSIAQGNQQSQEAFGKSQAFCQKYNAAAAAASSSSNPAAGCGVADDLASEAFEVAAGLANPTAVRQAALEFQQHCQQANNEGEEREERSSVEEDFDLLIGACNDSGSTETLLEDLRASAERNIPSSLSSSDRDIVERMINGENSRELAGSLPPSFQSSPFYRNVVRPLSRIGTDGSVTVASLDAALITRLTEASFEYPSDVSSPPAISTFSAERTENLCDGINSLRVREGLRLAGEENATDRSAKFLEGYQNNTPSGLPENVRTIASIVSDINRQTTQSQSGRIGENMNAVPCMAQQGANGANGFDLNGFDQGFLGAAGAGVLNALGL